MLFGSYRYAERVFLLLTLVFITYRIAAILGHPNWHNVVSDTVPPHLVSSKSFIVLAVAVVASVYVIQTFLGLFGVG